MFILSNIKKYVILAGVLGAIAFGAWKYYTYTQDQIRIYAQNAAVAEQAAQTNLETLERTQRDLAQVREQFTEVSGKFAVAERRVRSLEDKLARHELDVLALSKPKLVEKILDSGTQDVLRCLEIASGAPLTEEEINATSKSKSNQACPDIANPNYRP